MKVAVLSVGFPNFRYDYANVNLNKVLDHLSGYEVECCGSVLIDEGEILKETDRLRDARPDVLILMCGTYSYGSAVLHVNEAMKDVPLILMGFTEPRIEGFNGLPVNSLCALNMYASFLKRFGKKFDYLYGNVEDDAMYARLFGMLDAYRVCSKLRGVRFGLLGGRVPGFYLSDTDELNLKNKIGIDVVHYSLAEVLEDMKHVEQAQLDVVLEEMKGTARICLSNLVYLERTARMISVLRNYAERDRIQGYAIKCWPDLQKCAGISACTAVSYLNNGGLMTACEGDLPALVTQYIQYLYTGKPCFLADLVNVNENGSFKTWHCGPAPVCLAGNPDDVKITMHPTMKEFGPAMEFALPYGPVTVLKVSEFNGTLRMLSLRGKAIKEDRPMVANQCDVLFEAPVEKILDLIMNEGVEHHYCVVFEDVAERMKQFCRAAGIQLLAIGEEV